LAFADSMKRNRFRFLKRKEFDFPFLKRTDVCDREERQPESLERLGL
jgi:hypothetical protein